MKHSFLGWKDIVSLSGAWRLTICQSAAVGRIKAKVKCSQPQCWDVTVFSNWRGKTEVSTQNRTGWSPRGLITENNVSWIVSYNAMLSIVAQVFHSKPPTPLTHIFTLLRTCSEEILKTLTHNAIKNQVQLYQMQPNLAINQVNSINEFISTHVH